MPSVTIPPELLGVPAVIKYLKKKQKEQLKNEKKRKPRDNKPQPEEADHRPDGNN